LTEGGGELRAYLLGEPRLLYRGAPHAFRAPARAFSLLAYLLLHRDRVLTRDALAFGFWPDLGETDARTKLRAHLHYITSAGLPETGVPWILADKRTVGWNSAAGVWVDALDFESEATADPSRAIDLYGGDLMAGIDDEWIEPIRMRLRETQLELLLAAMLQARDGEPQRAVSCAQRILAIDPFDEASLRCIVAVRASAGDRAGAVRAYHEFAARLDTELGIAPAQETVAEYERAVSAAAGDTHPATPENLPAFITSFVGREADVADLAQTLTRTRLVTLTGAGGVGKTRLAIETARGLLARFPGGVHVVPFAAVASDARVASEIAGALRLESRSEAAVGAHLRTRTVLLVLDNCEHLPGIAIVIERLALQAPGLHVLATSRQPLRVTGERVERLAPLPAQSAVRLFKERAADVARVRNPLAGDAATIDAICARLDGIPLAIELAAASAGNLSLNEILQRLEDRFAAPQAAGSVMRRHQTMEATLDWSFDALEPREREIFARAGAFSGGWTAAAALALCSDPDITLEHVQDALGVLADRSLVLVESGGAETRYDMLETMRDYSLAKLAVNKALDVTSRRHAEYFADFAFDANRTLSGGMRDTAWFARLRPEAENLRAAMRWAIERDGDAAIGARLATAFAWFAYLEDMHVEAELWCESALAGLGAEPDAALEAHLRLALAICWSSLSRRDLAAPLARRAMELFARLEDVPHHEQAARLFVEQLGKSGRRDEAMPIAEETLRLARASGDAGKIAIAMNAKALASDDAAVRVSLMLESLRLARSIGNAFNVRTSLMLLGEEAFAAGEPAQALGHARECIGSLLEDPLPQLPFLAIARANAAAYALGSGELDAASSEARAALVIANQIGDRRRLAFALQFLAAVDVARGDAQHAACLFGASDRWLETTVSLRSFTEQSSYDALRAALEAAFSPGEFYALARAGRAWSLDRAVEEAQSVR
jgi:predicted ATPase